MVVHPCGQCLCAAKSPVSTDDDASWGCYAIGDAAADCESKQGLSPEHAPYVVSICIKRSAVFVSLPPLLVSSACWQHLWKAAGCLAGCFLTLQVGGKGRRRTPTEAFGDVSHHDNSQRLLMQLPTWETWLGRWGSCGKVFPLVTCGVFLSFCHWSKMTIKCVRRYGSYKLHGIKWFVFKRWKRKSFQKIIACILIQFEICNVPTDTALIVSESCFISILRLRSMEETFLDKTFVMRFLFSSSWYRNLSAKQFRAFFALLYYVITHSGEKSLTFCHQIK